MARGGVVAAAALTLATTAVTATYAGRVEVGVDGSYVSHFPRRAGPAGGGRARFSARVEALLANLTTAQKIGQMTQLDLSTILVGGGGDNDDDPTPDPTAFVIDVPALTSYLQNFYIGSFLNVPSAGSPNLTQWQGMLNTIQSVASSTGTKIPILYGLDSVHGANYVNGAIMFPQSINVAATFNRTCAAAMAATAAKDTRAAGIDWIFAPILGLEVQPIWPRVYETLGEDPFLASEMATQLICGAQGCPRTLSDPTHVAACMKHFIGYPATRSGQDRTPAWVPWRHLLNYFVPAFQSAVSAGVATAMESYSEVDGVPMASSGQYLQYLLRDMMGFDGMLVTDWAEIENQYDWHHVSSSPQDAVLRSISATSIDMSMVPLDTSFATYLLNLTNAGLIPLDRVDESAGRILALKEELGLLDRWQDGRLVEVEGEAEARAALAASVGSDADRAAALDAARQSLVLVQNNNSLLPLKPSVRKHGSTTTNLLLIGPSSNSISYQAGGWSLHWQGAPDNQFSYGTTVLAGLNNLVASGQAAGLTIHWQEVCDINGIVNDTSYAAALADAKTWADVIVYVGGETHYAEKPGNIEDLSLAPGQVQVMTDFATLGVPMVLVMLEGRPRLLGLVPLLVDGVIIAMLPGPDGGQAIAEVLMGVTVPSGRLPYSYPSQPGNALVHYWHSYPESDTYDPAWAFGTGLSYTTFTYSNLVLNATTLTVDQIARAGVAVTVTVTNAGSVAASTSVLVYLSDLYRSVTPEVKMLKGFDKVSLAAGASQTVTINLAPPAFFFWDDSFPLPQWVVEPGDFVVSLQDSSLTATITITP